MSKPMTPASVSAIVWRSDDDFDEGTAEVLVATNATWAAGTTNAAPGVQLELREDDQGMLIPPVTMVLPKEAARDLFNWLGIWLHTHGSES